MSDFMIFGYARVSTENQLENYSIDEQVERIKAYCSAKGWNLLHTYVDGGYSGGNTDRPALQEMLEAVRRKEADAVVVYKLDRLSRSQKDTLTLIEDEFLAHGTDFISINENFDTSSPFGRAMIGILSVFAQLEKDQITERFTMGRIGRSKAGHYHGGPTPPTGYQYIDGDLIVDPLGEIQVHQIFDLFTGGASINSIYQRIREEYGGNWTAAKVSYILKNSVYTGKVKFKDKEYDGLHQPIISKEQFAVVQQMFDKRPAPLKQPFRAEYLLSGVVYCARCGARYSANHGYYKCYSRAKSCPKFVVDPECKNDNWLIQDLDNYVVGAIKSLCNNKHSVEMIGRSRTRAQASDSEDAIRKKIAALDKQIEKLVELYQFSAIPMETLSVKVSAIRDEKAALTKKLEEKPQELPPFRDRARSFLQNFDRSGLDGKRLLIDSIVERITIDGDNVDIKFRV